MLLTKDDSILKVILPGLVAYKPVAYKKKVYTKWRRREILKSPVQCLRDLDIQQQKSSYHKSSLVKQILIMIDKHMSNWKAVEIQQVKRLRKRTFIKIQ